MTTHNDQCSIAQQRRERAYQARLDEHKRGLREEQPMDDRSKQILALNEIVAEHERAWEIVREMREELIEKVDDLPVSTLTTLEALERLHEAVSEMLDEQQERT